MRHMYEQFISAGEDWQYSSIVMNCRTTTKGRKTGKYVWKRYQDLVDQPLRCKLVP